MPKSTFMAEPQSRMDSFWSKAYLPLDVMRLHHLQRRDKSFGKWKVPGEARWEVIACSGVRTTDPSSYRPLNRATAPQYAGKDCWDVQTQLDWNAGNCFAWITLSSPVPLRHYEIFCGRRKRSNRREVTRLLVINSLTDIGCVHHPEWPKKNPTSWGSLAVMLIGQMMEPKDRALRAGLRSLLGDFFILFFFFPRLWGWSARIWIKHDAPSYASSYVDTWVFLPSDQPRLEWNYYNLFIF